MISRFANNLKWVDIAQDQKSLFQHRFYCATDDSPRVVELDINFVAVRTV